MGVFSCCLSSSIEDLDGDLEKQLCHSDRHVPTRQRLQDASYIAALTVRPPEPARPPSYAAPPTYEDAAFDAVLAASSRHVEAKTKQHQQRHFEDNHNHDLHHLHLHQDNDHSTAEYVPCPARTYHPTISSRPLPSLPLLPPQVPPQELNQHHDHSPAPTSPRTSIISIPSTRLSDYTLTSNGPVHRSQLPATRDNSIYSGRHSSDAAPPPSYYDGRSSFDHMSVRRLETHGGDADGDADSNGNGTARAQQHAVMNWNWTWVLQGIEWQQTRADGR